jgi:hypothetical protein
MRLYLKAYFAFIRAFFKPIDLVEKWCSQGHAVLIGWEYCPDCRWIDRAEQVKTQANTLVPQVLLYCFEGTHQGEVLSLKGHEESMGGSVFRSQVITSDPSLMSQCYRITLSPSPVLVSETKQPYQVNGIDAWSESLLDFDELEILGNKFVVLDLQFYSNFPISALKGISA